MVPFNSFSEFNKAEGGDIWFALDETRPLACFAGIWTNWTSGTSEGGPAWSKGRSVGTGSSDVSFDHLQAKQKMV